MIRLSPVVRLSLGLVLLTVSILLAADMIFGLSPFRPEATLNARKKLSESLAVQYSSLAARGDIAAITDSMQTMVLRNEDLLSAALRRADGEIVASAGDHAREWVALDDDNSTPTHAQVPIFNGEERWGTMEVSFTPLGPGGVRQALTNPFTQIIVFIAVTGFIGYVIYLKRSLTHLDPSAVIPGRVRTALNALAEGVVLMDEDEQIVLANSAFADKMGESAIELLGRNASEFDWTVSSSEQGAVYPWKQVILDGESRVGVPICLSTTEHGEQTFMVNATPILDDQGVRRGVLATFDDVTELEKKNEQLREMLQMLQSSRDEVRRQNDKLQVLATRDALTSCLNRGTFFERLQGELKRARIDDQPLCCIMADIDHFKSINDTFGHSAGDQVIQQVADIIRSGLRTIDELGRYGGEEFCVLLPAVEIDKATEIAERLRVMIQDNVSLTGDGQPDRRVTASFGVATNRPSTLDAAQFLDRADQALYQSKESGRNRVTCWTDSAPPEAAVG